MSTPNLSFTPAAEQDPDGFLRDEALQAPPPGPALAIRGLAVVVLTALLLALGWGLLQGWAKSDLNTFAAGWQDHALTLREGWAVPGATDRYPEGAAAERVLLPDDWPRSRPGHQGSVWYRLSFDKPGASSDGSEMLGVYIARACTSLEVVLNGELIHRGGRLAEPVTRNCYYSQLMPLPAGLLRPTDNRLDIRVVGERLSHVSARQRAGGLSEVRIAPLEQLQRAHDQQVFWNVTLAQILAGVQAIMGVFAIMLAWVRRLGYLFHFGLMCLGSAALSARVWWRSIPLPVTSLELLICLAFAPLVAFGVKFLLGYAGFGLHSERERRWVRPVDALLWLQCLALPASFLLVGPGSIFPLARGWYSLFALEVLAAIVYFVWTAARDRKPEFWLMCAVLGAVVFVTGFELASQNGYVPAWGVNISSFVLPLMFGAVAVRLIQVYARALHSAERARSRLEGRIEEITAEIERNFHQLADLRVEQIAEKERKRIAADLHDDLGAKLLTIVHTCDNDRIATLAREALEEMRLSVRGLTGRPVHFADALGDWRSEVVSRLGQAGIEVDWVSPPDVPDHTLAARTYVQTTRIVREAVSNIIKHAGASHVVISCNVNDEDFQLVIQDNGRGIPMELDGRLDRGHGMASMKHRAKQLSGQCLVESGPGFGTTLRLTLPLEHGGRPTLTPPAAPADTIL